MNLPLILVVTMPALVYFLSLRSARLRLARTEANASASSLSRRQDFAFVNAVWACLAALLTWLVAYSVLDIIIGDLLAEKLNVALQSVAEDSDPMPVDFIIDIIVNRVAFPELYSTQPTSIFIENTIQWYSQMRAFADFVIGLLIFVVAGALLVVRLKSKRAVDRARDGFERLTRWVLFVTSLVAIFCSIGIVATLLTESVLFFTHVNLFDFLFGLSWNPQIAIRADQTAAEGAFGFLPLLFGTLMIATIAMAVALPVGMMIAIYTAEYASTRMRNFIKPTLEILTGIPTVVYGAFAAIFVGPFLRDFFVGLGLQATVESALAVGIIMGIMITPMISSLIDDALHKIPESIREAMLALGATRLETIYMVLLPASLPGIAGALLLGISRAFGETMIVVMAAGLIANLTYNPLEAVTTVTVQIATILVGDQEFDSPKTLAAFALGLVLFVITLALNILAQWVSERYKVSYQ